MSALRLAIASILAAFLASGCSESTGPTGPEPVPRQGLVVEQALLDESGNAAESFRFGETLAFEITVWNDTGSDQPWTSGGAARAIFSVASGSMPVGLPVLAEVGAESWGVLSSGERMTVRAVWNDHPWNPPLPPGDYTASLVLDMSFDSLGVEAPEASFPFAVELPEKADEHIFSLVRTGGAEFCPSPGLFSATMVHSVDGGYVLRATRLERGETPCRGENMNTSCFVQVPYPTRPLTAVELRRFRRVLGEFPAVQPTVSSGCTACQETVYLLRGGQFRIGPCVQGPSEYRSRMGDLEEFLEDLLAFDAPPPGF